jgi:hypothetical protein
VRQLFDEGSVPQAAKFGLPEAQFMIAYNNFHGECDSAEEDANQNQGLMWAKTSAEACGVGLFFQLCGSLP